MTHQPPNRPSRFDRDRNLNRGLDRDFDRSADTDSAAGSSADLHSDGRPLPQEIYTRRRVAAVVVILAVVALVVWALSAMARSGGDDTTETPTAPPTTLVTTPTEPNPDEAGDGDGADKATETDATDAKSSDAAATEDEKPEDPEKSEDAEALAAKKTCELKDLQLTAELNKTAFSPQDTAEDRKFSVVIHNPTGADCVINTDESQLRFAAYSIGREGFQQIWSDTDCNKPMIAGQETFAAGESRKFTAAWSGLGSAPGQCDARPAAGPGAYAAVGYLGDNGSAPVTFNITE